MADYGLLGGLAEGLKQGLGAYQQGRQYQDEQRRKIEEKALQEKLAKLGMFDKGIMETPEGGFAYTPEKLEDRKLERDKAEAEIYNKYKTADTKGVKDPVAQALVMSRLEEMNRRRQEAEEKAAHAKTIEGRMEKLGAEGKQRLDNARMGFNAIARMQDAFNRGDNTFSLVGDNDFTMARTDFEEALGRMQSGGAISMDEERRFKGMAPTWRDSEAIQRKKLAQLQEELGRRLQTLGFKPEEFGLSYNTDQGLLKTESQQTAARGTPAPGLLKQDPMMPQAQAKQLSPEDEAALNWARQNPKDPRAAKIIQSMGR